MLALSELEILLFLGMSLAGLIMFWVVILKRIGRWLGRGLDMEEPRAANGAPRSGGEG